MSTRTKRRLSEGHGEIPQQAALPQPAVQPGAGGCGCPDRHLGRCNLRAAGCETLADVLAFLLPPWAVRAAMADSPDPDVREWLRRLRVIGDRVPVGLKRGRRR